MHARIWSLFASLSPAPARRFAGGLTGRAVRTSAAALLAAVGLAPLAPAQGTGAEPVRILPLGDSITLGFGLTDTGGFRAPLFELLEDNLFEVDFVGSAAPSSQTEFIDDWHHEGHSGWTLADLAQFPGGFGAPPSNIENWIEFFDPAIILLHAGTNDLGVEGLGPFPAAMRLQALLDRIFAKAPDVHVVVARIVPLAPAFYDWHWAQFNQGVDYLAEQYFAQGRSIRVADMFGAFTSHPNWAGLYLDPVHPNQAGYDVMAQVWYQTIASLIHGSGSLPVNPPLVAPPLVQTTAESAVNGAFTAATDDLINAGSPFLAGAAHFGYGGGASYPIAGLNDGDAGPGAALVTDPADEQWVTTFRLNTQLSPAGFDIDEVRGLNFAGGEGAEGGFGAQAFAVQFEFVGSPGVFQTVGSFRYAYSTASLAPTTGGSGELRLSRSPGPLASGVSSIRVRFIPDPAFNARTGYTELDVFGSPTPVPGE